MPVAAIGLFAAPRLHDTAPSSILGDSVVSTMIGDEGTTAEARRGHSGTAETEAAAFSALLDQGLAGSYRLAAVILGREDEAEDATHDAALRAWRHFGQLRDRSKFDAWFGRILVNVCRDRLARRDRRVIEISMNRPELADPGEDPEHRSTEWAALQVAIGRLSPDHRTVIALRYLDDLTVDQIAERTGVRQGTVKSRLHYALSELRAAYDAAARSPKESAP